MPTLSLLRHAKSSWDHPDLQDFDRPLNERGRAAAPRMGAFMAQNGVAPDLILCSPSKRTRQTLSLVLPHFATPPTVLFEEAIYLGAASTLLKRLRKLETATSHAMIVAHDPGLHQLAMELSGTGDPEVLRALAQKFPTAALAVVSFKTRTWSKIKAGAGRLELFVTPKHLS